MGGVVFRLGNVVLSGKGSVGATKKLIDADGENVFSFTVQLEGDSDAVRDAVMAACLKNRISIIEIYTDKPNLENVFIELINRPVKKSGLQELLDETPDESESVEGDDAEDDETEKEEE